jgi:cysteinyl-tRNA synthetase
MSRALLGIEIDIHTGGEDNIFPHHECEIAQSECFSGKQPFVRYWLHKRRIDLAGEKMSKSLGNVLTIPHILQKGFSALDLRYYFLSVHYRTNLKFTFPGLESARKVRLKVVDWFTTIHADSVNAIPHPRGETDPAIHEALEAFHEAMNADLNTPGALAPLFTLMNHYYASRTQKLPLYKEDARALQECIDVFQKTFGCFEEEESVLPEEVQQFLEQRLQARAEKNFKESDRLRDVIKKLGYDVRDDGKTQTAKKL